MFFLQSLCQECVLQQNQALRGINCKKATCSQYERCDIFAEQTKCQEFCPTDSCQKLSKFDYIVWKETSGYFEQEKNVWACMDLSYSAPASNAKYYFIALAGAIVMVIFWTVGLYFYYCLWKKGVFVGRHEMGIYSVMQRYDSM